MAPQECQERTPVSEQHLMMGLALTTEHTPGSEQHLVIGVELTTEHYISLRVSAARPSRS